MKKYKIQLTTFPIESTCIYTINNMALHKFVSKICGLSPIFNERIRLICVNPRSISLYVHR